MKLIVYKQYNDLISANLAKSKLENEGIRCFLFDENIVSVNPLYSLGVGGVKLMIRHSDLILAQHALAEINQNTLRTKRAI